MGGFLAGMGTLGEQLGLGRQINLQNQQAQGQLDLQKQAQQVNMMNYGLELQRLKAQQEEFQAQQDPIGHLKQMLIANGYPPPTDEEIRQMLLPQPPKPESVVQQMGQLYGDPQKFQTAWNNMQQLIYAPDQNGKPPSPQLVEIRAHALGIQGSISPPAPKWESRPDTESPTGASWYDLNSGAKGPPAFNKEQEEQDKQVRAAQFRMQEIETQAANRLQIAELNAKSKGSAQIEKAIHDDSNWQHAREDMLEATRDAHRIFLKMQNPAPGKAWDAQEISDFENQMQEANDKANEKAQLMNSIGDQIAARMSGQQPNPQGAPQGADNQTGALPGVNWPGFMGPQTGGKSQVLPGGVVVPPGVKLIR